jgi:phosphoglucosamine mutase
MGELFGTDGIRGRVGTWPITPDFFYKIGLVSGQIIPEGNIKTRILVGRDTRYSGINLKDALVSGMISSGVDVIDLGVITTPAVSMLIKKLKLSAGAVISASHNPVDQNGVKFFTSTGDKFSESQEDEIERLIFHKSLPDENSNKGILIDGHEYAKQYIQSLIEEHPSGFLKGLKILVDCSNGAASILAPKIFNMAGAEVVPINSEPNGKNINLDCGSEYARRHPDLFNHHIHKRHASLGIAFDGDGDRVVLINRNGELIDGDHIIGLLAEYLSKKGLLSEDSIVTTIMRNEGLKIYIDSLELNMMETPVGDKYVVQALKKISNKKNSKDKIGLGGEQAGHVILLNHHYTTGDGIRTALYVLRAFLESGSQSFSNYSSRLKKTPQVITSAYIGDGQKYNREDLDGLQELEISTNEGLSRLILRYSGTEPIFRVMIESRFSRTVNELAQISVKLCQKAQLLAGASGGKIDILNCQSGGLIEEIV